MDELMRLKAAAREDGCDYLTWNDIQACIDQVNLTVQEEHERERLTPYHKFIYLFRQPLVQEYNNIPTQF